MHLLQVASRALSSEVQDRGSSFAVNTLDTWQRIRLFIYFSKVTLGCG